LPKNINGVIEGNLMLQKRLSSSMILLLSSLIFFFMTSSLTQFSYADEHAWADYDIVVIKPGDTATFNIWLEGSGSFLLSALYLPKGWTVRFYYGSIEVSSVYLKGTPMSIRMMLSTSPDTLPGEYIIYFLASSPTTSVTLPLLVRVRSPVRGIVISTTNPYLIKNVGETLVYRLTITNVGEKDETLLLKSISPEGWNYSFLLQDEVIYGLNLKAGSSQQVTVKFIPPEDVAVGFVSFTVVAYSVDEAVNATINLYANLLPEKREVKILAANPYLSKKSGEALKYSLTIINDGDVTEFLLLKTIVPETWKVRFMTTQGESISGLVLGAKCSQQIIAEFTPLENRWTGNVQFTILVASNDGVINKSVTLFAEILPKERNVEITSPYREITIEQGQSFSVPIVIYNKGEDSEDLILRAILPEGWNGTFRTADTAAKVNSISLAAGSSRTLTFEATPMRISSSGSYIFMLEIYSTDGAVTSSYNLKVNIVRSAQPILSCQIPLKVTQPGGLARFQIKLVNPTSLTQVFKILVKDLPSGWDAKVKTADGESASMVNIVGGSSVALIVEVSVPNSVNNGLYSVILAVESSDFSESTTLYVDVQSPPVEIDLRAIPPYLDAYSGSEAQFKVQVLNSGGQDELLNITYLGLSEEFRVKFKDLNGKEITAIYVEASASKEFLVSVSIPVDAELGAKKFTVLAFNPNVRKEIDLMLNILGFYKIKITTTNFYTTLSVGGKGSFTLSVKNTGSMEVTNVRVACVSVPEGFTVDILPESISSLKINEEGRFTITISSEPNVNAGNYYIDFNVLSDQTERLSFTLRIEVFQTTNWLLYAGIGIIIALVLLVMIYRKFGRR